MFRTIGTFFLIIVGFVSKAQPIYFDDLYLFDDRADGIGLGGTQKLGDGYICWNSGFFTDTLASQQSMFAIDDEGTIISAFELPLIDSVREQSGNLIVLDDTTVVARGFEQILTQPVPGDFVLRKMNIDGTQYWKKRYGEDFRLDIPGRVIQAIDGGFVIVGQSTIDTGGTNDAQMMLVKTDSDGDMSWSRMYGGGQYEAGTDVVQTPDEGFLLLGWTRSFGAGQKDWYLVRTDAQGNEQWHKTYGDSNNQSGSSIADGPSGSYVLVGGGGQGNGRIIRIDSEGNIIWQQTYAHPEGTGSNYLFDCLVNPDSTIVATGLTNNSADGDAGWLLKADSEGNLLWQRKYNHNQYTDLFYGVLATDDGGFLLSGQAINDETNGQDAWLLKVDSIGCPYPNCTVGIEEEEKTVMVDVWPNPVVDVLNIEVLDPSAKLTITVTDMCGRQFPLSKGVPAGRGIHTEDVSAWPSGIYVLQGSDEKGRSFSVKVVKD